MNKSNNKFAIIIDTKEKVPTLIEAINEEFQNNNLKSFSIPKLYEKLLGIKEKPKKEKDMIIDITISLPKATPKPKRKVRVFNNFVKVGWNQYSIRIDPFTGYEYVKINSKRYEVVRDYFNQGVLIEI